MFSSSPRKPLHWLTNWSFTNKQKSNDKQADKHKQSRHAKKGKKDLAFAMDAPNSVLSESKCKVNAKPLPKWCGLSIFCCSSTNLKRSLWNPHLGNMQLMLLPKVLRFALQRQDWLIS